MAQEKYVGDENLPDLAIKCACRLRESKIPAYITGSVASVLVGKKDRANDIDIYVDGSFEEWGQLVRKAIKSLGFESNEGYREYCEGWQNIDQFLRHNGGKVGKDKTRDIWIDVYYRPVLLNPYLKAKIEEGLFLVKPEFDNGDMKLTASRITGTVPLEGK